MDLNDLHFLFFSICCYSLNEVEWDGKKIVVMDSVYISPPYDVASCYGKNGDNQAVEHVKKIVIIDAFISILSQFWY